MKFELRSDEDKVIGTLEVEKDFDKNNFIYFNTSDLIVKITFSYECNKCKKPLSHDCVGLTMPITTFMCDCGEFEGVIARKGYFRPHIGLVYKKYVKDIITKQMNNEIKKVKEKYKKILSLGIKNAD